MVDSHRISGQSSVIARSHGSTLLLPPSIATVVTPTRNNKNSSIIPKLSSQQTQVYETKTASYTIFFLHLFSTLKQLELALGINKKQSRIASLSSVTRAICLSLSYHVLSLAPLSERRKSRDNVIIAVLRFSQLRPITSKFFRFDS